VEGRFVIDDVETAVAQLVERGVEFADYDLPELKTVNHVATVGDLKFAWFRDRDANIMGTHSRRGSLHRAREMARPGLEPGRGASHGSVAHPVRPIRPGSGIDRTDGRARAVLRWYDGTGGRLGRAD
jgi:hypothetical protein